MTDADQVARFSHATRLIRCCNTHHYFNGHGWTDDPAQAQLFSDDIDAVRACISHDLHEIDLVLRTPLTGTEIFTTRVR